MNLEPIGFIRSCFSEKFGTPRQSGLIENAIATIHLNSTLQPKEALEGIENFSHLWILFLFNQNENTKYLPKIAPPRLEGKKIGVFATRSPHRPNPIGLSAVKLLKMENQTLFVSGADLVDGTPILDIKPYIAYTDAVTGTKEGWLKQVKQPRIHVEYTAEAEEQLSDCYFRCVKKERLQKYHEIFIQYDLPKLRDLFCEIISEDPRPVNYRAKDRIGQPHYPHYIFTVLNFNVYFVVEETNTTLPQAKIIKVELLEN